MILDQLQTRMTQGEQDALLSVAMAVLTAGAVEVIANNWRKVWDLITGDSEAVALRNKLEERRKRLNQTPDLATKPKEPASWIDGRWVLLPQGGSGTAPPQPKPGDWDGRRYIVAPPTLAREGDHVFDGFQCNRCGMSVREYYHQRDLLGQLPPPCRSAEFAYRGPRGLPKDVGASAMIKPPGFRTVSIVPDSSWQQPPHLYKDK